MLKFHVPVSIYSERFCRITSYTNNPCIRAYIWSHIRQSTAYHRGHPHICWGIHHDVDKHPPRGAAHKETCNFDNPLDNILKVMGGCIHIFCLVSIKIHIIRMLELQPSQFFYQFAA